MGLMGPMMGEPRPKEIITTKSLTLFPSPPSEYNQSESLAIQLGIHIQIQILASVFYASGNVTIPCGIMLVALSGDI
jgi:hypothetical protein